MPMQQVTNMQQKLISQSPVSNPHQQILQQQTVGQNVNHVVSRTKQKSDFNSDNDFINKYTITI